MNLFFSFLVNFVYSLILNVLYKSNFLLVAISSSSSETMDWTKWTYEASGVYKCTRALLRKERVQGASSDGEHINLRLCP